MNEAEKNVEGAESAAAQPTVDGRESIADDETGEIVKSSLSHEEEARRHTIEPSAFRESEEHRRGTERPETEGMNRNCESLEQRLASADLKLMKSEDTIRYLKELLMVKDKKMDLLKAEIAVRRTEPTAYQAHHKQVYSLVDKLQKTEEEVQAKMAELAAMKVEMQSNEEKAVLFDTLAMQNSKKDAKIEQLTRFLKASRTQMRQMAPQLARLQQREKSLQQELRELQAKYSLVPDTEIAQTIDRQREFSQENEELKERMVMKDMTVNELKLMKDTLEQELERSTLALKAVEEDKAKMEELMRRRIRQHEEKQEEMSKELAESRKQIIDLTAEVTKLQEDKRAAEGHANDLVSQLEIARDTNANLEREMDLYRTKMNDLESEDRIVREELQLFKRKLEASEEQYSSVRKEMAFKDACIQSLQQKLREATPSPPDTPEEEPGLVQPPLSPRRQGHARSSSRGHPHLHQGSRMDDSALDKAKQQIAEAKEACLAHQAHSSFMASEIYRIKREKKMELEIKNETIHRLRRELECTQQLYDGMRVDQALASDTVASTYSPPPQRLTKQRETSVSSAVSTSAADEIDDLKSQVFLLKQQYFRSMALGIKLQLTKFFVAPNINVDELFEKLPSDLPVQDWPKYIEGHIQAIIDKQQADGNLVSLRSN